MIVKNVECFIRSRLPTYIISCYVALIFLDWDNSNKKQIACQCECHLKLKVVRTHMKILENSMIFSCVSSCNAILGADSGPACLYDVLFDVLDPTSMVM